MSEGATACGFDKLIDRHFGRGLSLERERALRGHMPECSSCREYYKRHQLLERLDPLAPSRMTRLGRPLGLAGRKSGFAPVPAAVLASGALVLGVLTLNSGLRPELPKSVEQDSHYAARGLEMRSRVLAYRRDGSGEVARLSRAMQRSDALAFAVENPEGFKYLMVFAVDESDRVFWYHPEWIDSSANPTALQLDANQEVVELPEAIRHSFRPGVIELHYLFSNQPLSVKDVEKALLPKRHPGPIFPDARESIQRVRVEGEA